MLTDKKMLPLAYKAIGHIYKSQIENNYYIVIDYNSYNDFYLLQNLQDGYRFNEMGIFFKRSFELIS